MKGTQLYTWTVKVCVYGSHFAIALTDLNAVGMFSQSFATRYPSSGTDMIKCTTHSEHLEPQRSVPTQLQNQSLAPVVEERQTDAEQPEASLRAPGRKTTNEVRQQSKLDSLQ